MARAIAVGCCLMLICACASKPPPLASSAAPAAVPPTVTIQGVSVPNPDGTVTKFLANYAALPVHKALAVAVTARGEYAAGVAGGQIPGTVAAVILAMRDCETFRATKLLAPACELMRIDDRELELGITFRRRLHLDDGNGPTMLWRVQNAGATVYVGGSLHVLRATMLPLPAAFDRAYTASDNLIVEVDPTVLSPTQLAELTRKYSTLAEGQTLQQLLPTDTIVRLQQHAEGLGLPWAQVAQKPPGMVVATLTILDAISAGFDPGIGIDASYLRRAHADGKPVTSIETLDAQYQLLRDQPSAALTQYLDTTRDAGSAATIFNAMATAWFQADEPALLDFFRTTAQPQEVVAWTEQAIEQRNVGMTEHVIALLRSNRGSHFVLVGAGHLSGPKGVIALLRNAGFQPVQLDRAGDPLQARVQDRVAH